jgi:CBS-domain-containing membrane protein
MIERSDFLDAEFAQHRLRYVLQCVVATGCVFAVLLALDVVADTVSIASLGASAFIAFAMPRRPVSQPRLMVGGYIIGVVIGCLFTAVSYLQLMPGISLHMHESILGALAVGLTVFLMVITESEHPPAAGLALGLVLNGCDGSSIAAVLLGIIALALLKSVLQPVLIDLA